MFTNPGNMTPQQIRAAGDINWRISHRAQTPHEQALVEDFRKMCRENGIRKIPEVRFSTSPQINAHALPHRCGMILHKGLMDTVTDPNILRAVMAHEMGHILRNDVSFTRENEYACDRLAVLLTQNHDDVISIFQTLDKAVRDSMEKALAPIKEMEDGILDIMLQYGLTDPIRQSLIEQGHTVPEDIKTLDRETKIRFSYAIHEFNAAGNSTPYGTLEEREANVRSVELNDRTELTNAIRQYNGRKLF